VLRGRFRVGKLAGPVLFRLRDRVLGFTPGLVQRLGGLTLDLGAVALRLCVALVELCVRVADLGLRPGQLSSGRLLGAALEPVREIGRRANQVQRIHAPCVADRLDCSAARCRLQDAQLRLVPGELAAERVERLRDFRPVEALLGNRQVLEPRHADERRLTFAMLRFDRHP
jgi:hypothetical protein